VVLEYWHTIRAAGWRDEFTALPQEWPAALPKTIGPYSKFSRKTANINVKNCRFTTVCKAHSSVAHIKQQKYFHHLKGSG